MSKLAISIDLGGTNLRGGLVNSNGSIVKQETRPIGEDRSEKGVLKEIVYLVRDLSKSEEAEEGVVIGLGLGVPGFVNPKKGIVHSSPNYPEWNNFEIQTQLKEWHPTLETVIENDANLHTLGEAWKGNAKGFKNVVLLTLGTGVGGGVLVDGNLLQSTHGAGNELGHIVIEPEGPECGCGGRGCLEQFISGGGIERNMGTSSEDAFIKAQENDTEALELFKKMGRYLGIGLTTLAYIFDPEIFVLGGRTSRAFKYFEPTLKEEFLSRLKNHPAKDAKIVTAKLEDDAGIVGGAKFVFQRLDK